MAERQAGEEALRQTFETVQACLASPIRMGILLCLVDGPCDVSTLGRALGLDLPLLSNHLAILRRDGMVDFDRRDRFHVYRLSGRIAAGRSATHVELTIHADDGSRTGLTIPREAIASQRPRLRLQE